MDLNEAIREWCKERDEVLRSLDVKKFAKFWRKHKLPMPKGGWASPDVPLIMIHKCRLQVESMTEEEQEVSRAWLISHGYSPDIE